MSSRRLSRMGEEIKKLVSNLIMNEVKDPRVSPMTSVIQVEVTRDLRYAKIYISVMGTEKEKQDTLAGLNSSKGFIRKEIGQKINMRYTPEPIFELDSSIDHGIRISEMLRDINKE
ncbi:ribosome-binding factor A [Andreesenia angusta]|uniref:Ribosome-binding factor A n=1 Tax=Andreesenia angusta TaxID=39480 RepID=A0A1S1V8I0_9FIRM|nr:30S ribosome-binding factor RbfA [Andreesenia angusta]OHW62804.1 ribosome-binding factor A [Andreesenia angusta]